MRTLSVLMSLALVLLLLSGCTAPSDHVESTETTLSVEYPAVALGPAGYAWVNIKGGNAPYKVRSIGDSSVVTAYVPSTRTGTTTHVELTALGKLGTTSVTVQDSTGLTGTITVRVETFAVFPTELMMRAQTRRTIRVQGGTMPYTMTTASDSGIALTPYTSFVEVFADRPGTYVVSIADASVPVNVRQVVVTVVPRSVAGPGMLSFRSTLGDVSWEGTLDPWGKLVPGNAGVGARGLRTWNGSYESANIQALRWSDNGDLRYAFLGMYDF